MPRCTTPTEGTSGATCSSSLASRSCPAALPAAVMPAAGLLAAAMQTAVLRGTAGHRGGLRAGLALESVPGVLALWREGGRPDRRPARAATAASPAASGAGGGCFGCLAGLPNQLLR